MLKSRMLKQKRAVDVYLQRQAPHLLVGDTTDTKYLPIPPDDIEAFYRELGCPFLDSKSNASVTKWNRYQRRAVRNHRKHLKFLLLKGQKMGISSLFIIVSLWHALMDCQSYELIILAQSKDKAIEHGRDMRHILANSKKYKDYLIEKPSDAPGLLRDEVTKITEIYLKTRNNPSMPTKIHILSPSVGSLASFKRVKFAWLSDITLVKDIVERQNSWFTALTSRLILTEGPVVIECPTVGHLGPIWQIDDRFQKAQETGQKLGKFDFFVDRLRVQEAVKEGMMTQAAVDALRREHGPMFAAYFEADWFAGDSTWYSKDQIKHSDDATRFADD